MGDNDRLGSAAISILVALAPGERHGYAIMRDIEEISGGRRRLAAGTLYTNIKRLVAAGLIEETDERPDPSLDDERRRYYRLTGLGRATVFTEVERMEALVTRARPWVEPGP